HRARRAGAFHEGSSAVVLHNLKHHGEAETRPVLLALANERLENLVAQPLGDAVAIVAHPDLDLVFALRHRDVDSSWSERLDCFTGIHQQVLKYALQLPTIKPAFDGPAVHLDPQVAELRIGTDHLHGAVNHLFQRYAPSPERAAWAGEFEQ